MRQVLMKTFNKFVLEVTSNEFIGETPTIKSLIFFNFDELIQ